MSYPISLEEHNDSDLVEELRRRALARARGKCSYCGDDVNGKRMCRYPSQHVSVPPRIDTEFVSAMKMNPKVYGLKKAEILKVQRPMGGGGQELLVYNKDETLTLSVPSDGPTFKALIQLMGKAFKIYVKADVDRPEGTLRNLERVPDQDW